MKRKDFILKSIGAGVLAGSASTFGSFSSAFSATRSSIPYDLVAVRGGGAAEMFDRGMAELGGMSQFVQSGQSVVIKPNASFDLPPERAANTNPELMGRIVEHCLEAGASRVRVFDHTLDGWRESYSRSGIEKAVNDAGGQMVPANSEGYYQEASIPNGRRLTETREHELLHESDVFINVPVLKHHGGASVSIAMKNMMGNVWDRRYYHRNDLHQCVADYSTLRKPDLNIVDAYRVIMRNGPRGVSEEDIVTMEAQVISPDIVAADAASSLMFGLQPQDVGHIRIGEEMGIGTMQLEDLNISRIRI